MKVLHVASNTLREAVRDRILYLLLFFALGMMAVSRLLSMLTMGDPRKIIVDVGLGSISFFSVLIAVFMGIGLISREIERRTIYAVVSKPLSRGAFVCGKFLGLMATIAIIQAVMTLFFAATLHVWGTAFTREYLFAIVLSFLEAGTMLAVALLFSALASSLLASMFTLATYMVGHWLDSVAGLIRKLPPSWPKWVLATLYHVFPNLERLNIKGQVVFPEPELVAELPRQFLLSVGYGIGYTAGILGLAVLAYRRKDFV